MCGGFSMAFLQMPLKNAPFDKGVLTIVANCIISMVFTRVCLQNAMFWKGLVTILADMRGFFLKCHFKTFILLKILLFQTAPFLCGVNLCVSSECFVLKRSTYNSCKCAEISPWYFFKCHFETLILIKVF